MASAADGCGQGIVNVATVRSLAVPGPGPGDRGGEALDKFRAAAAVGREVGSGAGDVRQRVVAGRGQGVRPGAVT